MSDLFTTPKYTLEQAREINQKRWLEYANRLDQHFGDASAAYRALTVLMSSINSRRRWRLISKEEFLKYFPDYNPAKGETDWEIGTGKDRVLLHFYKNPTTGEEFFSRLAHRKQGRGVLTGWFNVAVKQLQKRKMVLTDEFKSDYFNIGSEIIKSIQEGEGVWRRTDYSIAERIYMESE